MKNSTNLFKRQQLLILAVITILTNSFSTSIAQDLSNIKKDNWFDLSGNIGFNLSFSDYGNNYAQQSPWSSVVSGGLNLNIAGVDIPLSFAYVDGKSSYMHPFTRYGLSPRYKDITLHLGYRNINLSSNIFSGKTFLGGGTEVNVGAFRFAGFYGEIEEARAFDSTMLSYMPSYSRMGMGGKIGFTAGSFVLDFILFKAKDDTTSVKTLMPQHITPQDNLAAGIFSSFSFLSHFNFSTEWAISGHTKDIRTEEIDNEYARKYSSFLNVRSNSTMGFNTNNVLGFYYKTFGLQLNYRLITQDYQSFGVPNMATNNQSISVNSNLSLLDSKLNLSGFFSRSNDNLSKKQIMTSTTNTFGTNLNYIFSESFSIDGGYNGTLVNQDPSTKDTTFSSFGLDNHSFNLNPSYSINMGKLDHRFSLPIDYFFSDMENSNSEYNSQSSSYTFSPSYSLSIQDLDLSTGINYSYANSKADAFITTRHSVGVHVNKTFLEKKELSVNIATNFGIDSYNNNSNNSLSVSGGVSYRLLEQHNFSFNLTYSNGSQSSYYNFRSYLSYQWGIPPLSKWLFKNKEDVH